MIVFLIFYVKNLFYYLFNNKDWWIEFEINKNFINFFKICLWTTKENIEEYYYKQGKK